VRIDGLGRVNLIKVIHVTRPNGNVLMWGRSDRGFIYRTGEGSWRNKWANEIAPKSIIDREVKPDA